MVHARNTTYTGDNLANNTKPEHRNNANVDRYTNTEDSQKHEKNIY